MKLNQKTTEKKIKTEINSDKELTELKKTIFDEAVNVRLVRGGIKWNGFYLQ